MKKPKETVASETLANLQGVNHKKNAQVKWINAAKFASIFLVVLYHCPPSIDGVAGLTLSYLIIPPFFFLAGLLFDFERHPSFIAFIKLRSRQLLIPYFCFFFFFYLVWLSVGRNLSSPEEMATPVYAPLLEYLYGRPLMVDWPLWFIAALFSMQCVFYLFRKIDRRISVAVIFLLSLIPHLTDMSQTPWMLDSVCDALPYYAVASLYKKEIFRFMEMRSRFLIGFMLLIIHFTCNLLLLGRPDMYLSLPTGFLCGFSVIIPFFILIKGIADKWEMHSPIQYLAANTIIILACHTYVIRFIEILASRIIGDSFFDGQYALKTVIALTVMISMSAPVYIINRYFPFVLGRGGKIGN
ncbi:MAG: acyltransferase [Tannerella sp.]|jgi:fucose 4-O-acetylase-like acetyltransferase|nr:acyltransferase [Tannerella sp.]